VTTREARLERLHGDDPGAAEVLAGRPNEMQDAVEAVLGLGFAEFTRAVVLPQGAFARLLHDKPAARMQLLEGLLGVEVYRKVGERARRLAQRLRDRAAHDRERLAELAGATAEACAAARREAEAWQGVAAAVAVAREVLTRAAETIRSLAAEEERLERFGAALGATTPPDELAGLAAARAEAQAAVAAAEAAEAEAQRRLEETEAALASHPPAARVEEWVAGADEAAALSGRRAELTDAAEAARAAEAQAEADHEAAVAELEAARRAHAAHALRAHLRPGEPCPVCEQPVGRLPSGAPPGALAAAEDRVRRAERARRRAASAARAADAAVQELEGRLAAVTSRLAGAPDRSALDGLLERVRGLTAERDDARRALSAARRAADAARRDARRAADALGGVAAAFRAARDGVVSAGGAPPPETGEVTADWPALRSWAERARPGVDAELSGCRERLRAARRDAEEQLAGLRARVEALGARPGETVDEIDRLAVTRATEAEAAAARIAEAIRERARLEARVRDLEAREASARALEQELRADRFLAWLLTEALERLAEGASVRLGEISRGRYALRFDEADREFLVVDHANASETRPVRTLSGGETFQASLALALSLADQLRDLAADATTRLEAVFLDEGFGTLDAESLEVVAATIENLAAEDRMVGIVTHVPDLAERMPVQLRVSRGPGGARVDKVVR
jgi:exonuclease SbcC